MPDPTHSDDIAEQLLAPATDAAVQSAMSRLGGLAGTGIGSMTVEGMIREMLRPLLKDWLDENLPALVERMVEKEIARISRGVK
jgi:cell pole-organizing protein PopZ